MRKFFILVQVIGLIMLLACKSGTQVDIPEGKEGSVYGVKSGMIKYKPMNTMGMTMTRIVFFDEYGNREVRETFTEGAMMGQTMKMHAIDIREGLTNIHYELENIQNGQNVAKKEAYKETLPKDFMKNQNLAEMSEEMKKLMAYQEVGTETVAGIEGVKYTIVPDSSNPSMIATGVHYKNIPLKFSMATVEMVAEVVDFDAKIPAEKFKIPEGYKIIEKEIPAELEENSPLEEEDKSR